jgi:hypothetical protein
MQTSLFPDVDVETRTLIEEAERLVIAARKRIRFAADVLGICLGCAMDKRACICPQKVEAPQ